MKESGRDYLNFLVHTMPKYIDNIFISAKIERFNFQDSHKDSLKLIILKGLFYCFAVGLHSPGHFGYSDIQDTLSLTHEDVNSAASHTNDRMSSILVLRSHFILVFSNVGMLKYFHPNKQIPRKRA